MSLAFKRKTITHHKTDMNTVVSVKLIKTFRAFTIQALAKAIKSYCAFTSSVMSNGGGCVNHSERGNILVRLIQSHRQFMFSFKAVIIVVPTEITDLFPSTFYGCYSYLMGL